MLPAELRRRAGLRKGQELVLIREDGILRLATKKDLARAGRGMFADAAPGRDLVAELLAERREEGRREAGKTSRSKRPRRK